MKTELNELLQFAVELGRGAGDITLEYFRKQPETTTKSDGSYVTIADRQAESYLRREIAKRFPDDGVLGEEEGESTGRSGRRWIMRQDLLHRAASGRSLLRGPLSLIGRQQRLGQFELGAGDQRSPDGVGWLNRDQTIGFVHGGLELLHTRLRRPS